MRSARSDNSYPKISLFMPAYNASLQISGVIDRIPEDVWPLVCSCWIINDGSTDETADAIKKLTRSREQIKAIHFKKNQGYGKAVRKGLALCAEDGCDYAFCVHSDGQYPPESIPEFITVLEKDRYDILQGSRIASGTALSGGMPFYKYVAGKSLTFLENRIFKLSMTDYHSGFLSYSKRALQLPFNRLSTSFDFDLEVIASARARGLKVGELPIPTRYADEESHLNPITYGLRVVRVMVKYLFGGYRSGTNT